MSDNERETHAVNLYRKASRLVVKTSNGTAENKQYCKQAEAAWQLMHAIGGAALWKTYIHAVCNGWVDDYWGAL